MIDNMHYIISEFKNKIAYLGAVNFKTKDYKYLGTLNLHSNSTLSPRNVVFQSVSKGE